MISRPISDHFAEQRQRILETLPSRSTPELRALDRESDPGFFFEGLYLFARQAEARGRLAEAAQAYRSILEANPEPVLRERAQRNLEALSGRGSFGPRAEFLLRRLAQQGADPAALFGMAAAGAVFRLTRLAVWSRLAASPANNFWTRGFGAGFLGSLAGFGAEAPTFVLANHVGDLALQRDRPWDFRSLAHEVASNYLFLGGMRLAGWGTERAFRPFSNSGTRFQPFLQQQAGMLGGILLGHRLEQSFGLSPRVDGATTLADSLALLLQFHVAGRLHAQAFGEGPSAAEMFRGEGGPRLPQVQLSFEPPLALAGEARPLPEIFPSEMRMERLPNSGGASEARVSNLSDQLRSFVKDRTREIAARLEAEDGSSPELRRALTEELDLLKSLRVERALDFFQDLDLLRRHYFRNVRRGGIEAARRLSERQQEIFRYVRQNHLESAFLQRNAEGRVYFNFPHGMEAPSTLVLPAEPGLPGILSLHPSGEPSPNTEHYFRISDFMTGQEVVSVGKVEEYQGMVQGLRNFKQLIHAAIDRRRGCVFLMDGHHRSVAASLEGHTYVLGKVMLHYPLVLNPHPISEVRQVSYEEYLRVVARLQNSATGMNEGSLLRDQNMD